jgi:cbb3-type cytochrome oxidase subunit 3
MSLDIIIIAIAIVVIGILFHALTPRGLDHFQDAIRLPLGRGRRTGSD